jgi:hypothetical protein
LRSAGGLDLQVVPVWSRDAGYGSGAPLLRELLVRRGVRPPAGLDSAPGPARHAVGSGP